MLGTSLSLAQDPTGTWKGKLNIKFPAMPANAPAEQKAQMQKMQAQLQKAVLTLVMKKDKTYSLKSSSEMMSGRPNNEQKGKWSVKGNTVTLSSSSKGPNGQGAPDQAATLSKDGKTMTILIPNGAGSVVFKR